MQFARKYIRYNLKNFKSKEYQYKLSEIIKEKRSWSKLNIPDLIARKHVDYSVFQYGSHIPLEFHEDFNEANGSITLNRGERREVTLIIEGKEYKAALVNIDRKGVEIDTLQLRYDSNNDLKKLLKERFQRSYNYIEQNKIGNQLVIVPDSDAEYMEFYKTKEPFRYLVKLISHPKAQQRNIWWVNQKIATLNTTVEHGILWAPLKTSDGRTQYHWETMAELRIGDIVLHYANGALRYVSEVLAPAIIKPKPNYLGEQWEGEGRLVKVRYHKLQPSIKLNTFNNRILELNINRGPLDVNGSVKQGFLFYFSQEGLKIVMEAQPKTDWPEFITRAYELEEDNSVLPEAPQEKPNEGFENHGTILSVSEVLGHICSYIAAQGFTFEEELIKNFYLSLKTKPFVILAGISGTGKSKIGELFAAAVGATEKNGRYRLIPVRPDWNDSADLLGYYNLQGEFVAGPLVKVIKDAIQNPYKPYFVCLDEMNLARVEYYFSEFLSIIESRKLVDGRIISHGININGHEHSERDGGKLYFPENLYVIGTVNMDETTYAFSRKVLDRANTIELTEVNLSKFPEVSEAIDAIEIDNRYFKSDYLLIKDCYVGNEAFIQEKVQILEEINSIIARGGFQVGYRVRDEFCFYLLYNKEWGLLPEEQAVDFQILQKILPRIQGSDGQVKEILEELERLFTDRYPASLRKVQFMLGRLESDGFTSFWP